MPKQPASSVRQRYGIPGGTCGDLCAQLWCPCCSPCQEHMFLCSRLGGGGGGDDHFATPAGLLA